MRFSQRIKKKPIKIELQIDSMDNDLRIGLWNVVDTFYLEPYSTVTHEKEGRLFTRMLYSSFLKLPLDTMEDFFDFERIKLKKLFFGWEWFEVYDFIEFVANFSKGNEFRKACNYILENELSGYRFVGKEITPITSEIEINEIEQAIELSNELNFSGVTSHLETALLKLSDKKKPDYRNSIKESISAVEATAQIVSGNQKATLGQALELLENKANLHPALKRGFSAIYGYTSNADGIRHAMVQDSNSDFDDAKYMLVSCSAFVNYLIMKAKKAGII
ncbi:MAG: hypothetical protein H6667_24130 [Ardenticatenaceae bacterium]|nr:hypothetical protein [Ardenticatenaceae bacterium]